jgi:mRNA interferase RelE/StbE
MSYEIELANAARKFLLGLKDRQLRDRLESALVALGEDPFHAGVIKMAGGGELYRVRVGGYRIIYEVNQGRLRVLVVKIGKRGDVYR